MNHNTNLKALIKAGRAPYGIYAHTGVRRVRDRSCRDQRGVGCVQRGRIRKGRDQRNRTRLPQRCGCGKCGRIVSGTANARSLSPTRFKPGSKQRWWLFSLVGITKEGLGAEVFHRKLASAYIRFHPSHLPAGESGPVLTSVLESEVAVSPASDAAMACTKTEASLPTASTRVHTALAKTTTTRVGDMAVTLAVEYLQQTSSNCVDCPIAELKSTMSTGTVVTTLDILSNTIVETQDAVAAREAQVEKSSVAIPSVERSSMTGRSAVRKALDEWHIGKQAWQVAAAHVSMKTGQHACDISRGTGVAVTPRSQFVSHDDGRANDSTTCLTRSLHGTPSPGTVCCNDPLGMSRRQRREADNVFAVAIACKKWKLRAGELVGKHVVIGVTRGVVSNVKTCDDRLGGQSVKFVIDVGNGEYTVATLRQVLQTLTSRARIQNPEIVPQSSQHSAVFRRSNTPE